MKKAAAVAPLSSRKAKAMVKTIFEHHFKKKPKRVVIQNGGLSNFVFLVYHSEGAFVVRLSPEAGRLSSYLKEQWAIAKAREAGIPTPTVLEVGHEIVPHPYMILRKVEGEEATNHPNRIAILRELGRYAAIINSIRTNGFGSIFDWSGNQLSRKDSWREYLNEELNLSRRLQILSRNRMISQEQLIRLREVLESAEKLSFKPTLNHGDLRLKNVMVDKNGKILAIIDWENCTSNLAPQWELSLALHDLSIDEKDEFVEGYGLPRKKLSLIVPLVKAFNIINYVPKIEQAIEAKDEVQFERYRLRLSGALDLYSL